MPVPSPFLIFGLPRSRTRWLATWLTCGQIEVGHDLAITSDTVQDFISQLWARPGTIETGAMCAHRLIRRAIPGARFITIRRPRTEVSASLHRFGVEMDEELAIRDAYLDEIEADGALRIDYAALNSVTVCADLWSLLLDIPFDFDRWRAFRAQNIQIDMHARLDLMLDRQGQIATLKAEVERLATAMGSEKPPRFFRIGAETWHTFWPEAEPLGERHNREVNGGEQPGAPYRLDPALMRAACASGAVRIISARVNGDLVGYLFWTIGPDPEAGGVLQAIQGPLYVDPGCAGFLFARRMWRLSKPWLQAIGVKKVDFHHQLHGRGADMGAWFQHLGAVPYQKRYTMWIGDTPHG